MAARGLLTRGPPSAEPSEAHAKSVPVGKSVGDDDEPVGASLLDRGEGAVQIIGAPRLYRLQLHAQRFCCGLRCLPSDPCVRIGRLTRATTRDSFGTACLNSSSRFPSNSGASVD